VRRPLARESLLGDLRRTYLALRGRLPLLLVTTLVASLATLLWLGSTSDEYETTATASIGREGPAEYNQVLADQVLINQYAFKATTTPFLEAVRDRLSFAVSLDDLERQVTVTADPIVSHVRVTARDADPERAAEIANAVISELQAVVHGSASENDSLTAVWIAVSAAAARAMSSTQASIDRLLAIANPTVAQQAQLDAAWMRLATIGQVSATYLALTRDQAGTQVDILEPAPVPSSPAGPGLLIPTLLGGLVGLLFGSAVALGFERVERPLRGTDGVREATGLQVLGLISGSGHLGRGSPLPMLHDVRGRAADGYRTLRANIDFATGDQQMVGLLVAGTGKGGERAATVAANLAIAYARVGRRVILVDADLRQPHVHRLFHLQNGQGLSTVLAGPHGRLGDMIRTTNERSIRIITAGPPPPDTVALLDSERMRASLVEMAGLCDLIIVAAPSFDHGPDVAILASMLDGTLLVVDSNDRREVAHRVASELERARAWMLGAAVLGGMPSDRGTDHPSAGLRPVGMAPDRSQLTIREHADSA